MFMKAMCGVAVVGCALGLGGRDVRANEKPSAGEAFDISEGLALPTGRGNHAGGMISGHVVVAGGTTWSADRTTKQWLSDSLVLKDGTWSPGPPLPHAVSEPAFASDGLALYIAGGRRGAAETNEGVYRLSEVNGKLAWATLPKLPATITAGAAAIVNGRMVVTCGSTQNAPTNQTWSLNVAGDAGDGAAAWRACKALPGPPRMYPAFVECAGFVYLFGGMRPTEERGKRGMEALRDAYRYDPEADAWERLADLPAKGYCWAAAAVDDQSVLLTGRADGVIQDDVWLVNVPEMRVQGLGRTVIPSTCAPLVRIDAKTWWLVGGEPDSNKTRTEKVSVIKRVNVK